MNIEAVDLDRISDADLAAWHDLKVTVEAELTPGDEVQPLADFVAWVRNRPAARKVWCWLGWDDDRERVLALSMFMFWDEPSNRDHGSFWVYVRPEVRRTGLGTSVLRPLLDVARANGRTLLDAGTSAPVPAGAAFLESLGGRHAFTGRRNALDIDGLDLDLLHEWVDHAKERADDYRLDAWDAPCADDRVEAFVAAMAIMNTAPREEFEAEDDVFTVDFVRDLEAFNAARGAEQWVIAAVHEPTGEIAGYTELVLPTTTWPTRGFQGDTGVDPNHRKRGLGRWLKASMLLRLVDERPTVRRVETFNAGSNEPMLNINHALGFKCIEDRAAYQFPLDTLAERLSR